MEQTTMNVRELAAQLGVSLPVAYTVVQREDFPKIRLNKRIIVPIDGFKRWLEQQSAVVEK